MIRFTDMTTLTAAMVLSATVLVPPDARPATSLAAAEPSEAALPDVGMLARAQPDPGAEEPTPAVPEARRRPHPRQLSPEFIESCLEVAAEVDPDLATTLQQLRLQSPGPAFERAIRNARHLVGLARLKERDPQLYDVKLSELRVDAQVSSLAEQVRQTHEASSGAAAELEDQLRNLVRQQVGLSIAARGMYLQRLRENLKTLQDQLATDSANFEKTVDRRLRELIGPQPPSPPVQAASPSVE